MALFRCGGDLPIVPKGKAYKMNDAYTSASLVDVVSGTSFTPDGGMLANVEGFTSYAFGGGTQSSNTHIMGIKKDGTTIVSTGMSGSIAGCVLAYIKSSASPASNQNPVTFT